MLPDARGLDALGIGEAETVLWWGAIVPARTPDAIVEKLRASFAKAAETDEFERAMAQQGGTIRLLDGPATAQLIRDEQQALGSVAAALGIKKPAG